MQWYQAQLAQPVIKIPELIPKILHRKSWLKAILLTILLEFPVLRAITWPPCQLIHGKSTSTWKKQQWKGRAIRKFPSPTSQCSAPGPGCSRPNTQPGPGELVCSAHQTLHLPALLQLCASPGPTAGLKASVLSVWSGLHRTGDFSNNFSPFTFLGFFSWASSAPSMI